MCVCGTSYYQQIFQRALSLEQPALCVLPKSAGQQRAWLGAPGLAHGPPRGIGRNTRCEYFSFFFSAAAGASPATVATVAHLARAPQQCVIAHAHECV